MTHRAQASSIRTKEDASAMYRVSLRSVLAHKVRLVLTVLAVALGTAFVSGSLMFTNALSSTFDGVVNDQIADVDAVVNGAEGQLPASILEDLRKDEKIDRVNINGSQSIVAANTDREPYQTGAASPLISVWYDQDAAVSGARTLVEGNAPQNVDEVLISEDGAKSFDIEVGQRIIVVDGVGQREVTITGLYHEEGASHPGITLLTNEAGYIERYSNGFLDSLTVSGTGDDAQATVDHIEATYPGTSVTTGQALAEQLTEVLTTGLKFVNYFLVAFGLIALLVGTFIIANTFSMIVAQRLREFALLRALGVSRKQLSRSVVLEAIIVGAIGSAIGILGGIALVLIIQAVMSAFGMSLPETNLGVSLNSVLVPFLLGVVVTVVSAWAPAQKAGRVRPVEAMRSTETSTESSLVVRTVFGVIGIAIALGLVLFGALNDDAETKTRAILVGAGAFFLIVGVFLAAPALSIPVVGLIGRIVGAPFGRVGRLAATNSRRNPKRTATTAFALTLGVALVSAVGMLSATMRDSVSDMVSSEIKGAYVLSGPDSSSIGFPGEALEDIRNTEGVQSAVVLGGAEVTIGDAPTFTFDLRNTASGNLEDAVNAEEVQGSLDLTEPNRFVAETSYAEAFGWKIGDTVPIRDRQNEEIATAELVGTYAQSNTLGKINLSQATVDNAEISNEIKQVIVLSDGSVSDKQLGENLSETVKDYMVIQVRSAEEYAGEQAVAIGQLLNIIYALLGLAVIVAVVGIINTLALNVIERRQEIGMLRAIGTHRSQIRTMISIESVQIALFGAVLGLAVGLGLGWSFLKVLMGAGIENISIPYMQITYLLVGSAVVGVIAALWPARNAAKTPPLDAIAD